MSLWPRLTSQALVVPPGISAQSCPSVAESGALSVDHQPAVPVVKSPLGMCCVGSADAGSADRDVSATVAATAAPVSAVTRLRRYGVTGVPSKLRGAVR